MKTFMGEEKFLFLVFLQLIMLEHRVNIESILFYFYKKKLCQINSKWVMETKRKGRFESALRKH